MDNWSSTLELQASKATAETFSPGIADHSNRIQLPEDLSTENLKHNLIAKNIITSEEVISRKSLIKLYEKHVLPLPQRSCSPIKRLNTEELHSSSIAKTTEITCSSSREGYERKRKMGVESDNDSNHSTDALKVNNLTVHIPSISKSDSRGSRPVKLKRKSYDSTLRQKQEYNDKDTASSSMLEIISPPSAATMTASAVAAPISKGSAKESSLKPTSNKISFDRPEKPVITPLPKNFRGRTVKRPNIENQTTANEIIEIVQDEEPNNVKNALTNPAETIQVSIGGGKTRSSIVVAKDDEESLTDQLVNSDEKTSKVHIQKTYTENKKSEKSPEMSSLKDKSRELERTDVNKKQTYVRSSKSPEKRYRSRSNDHRERRHAHGDRRRIPRSPVRRRDTRQRSPFSSNYNQRRQFFPRWQDRGRRRGGFDVRRRANFNDRGRGRSFVPYNNNNRRFDTGQRSREDYNRNQRSEERRNRPRRKSETSRKVSSSSSSSSSSDSDDIENKGKKSSKDKLSNEEKNKIKKELEEIEMKMKRMRKNVNGEIDFEKVSQSDTQPVVGAIESAAINVAIHSGHSSVDRNEAAKSSKLPIDSMVSEKYNLRSKDKNASEPFDHLISVPVANEKTTDMNEKKADTHDSESSEEERIKKPRKKSKKKKQKTRGQSSDNTNREINENIAVANENTAAIKIASPEIGLIKNSQEETAFLKESADKSDEDGNHSSNDENSSNASKSVEEEEGEENSSNSSDSSETSESESEVVKKKSKKKKSKKKKKRRHHSVDSSSDDSSDESDSSGNDSGRYIKKKKRKHSKKKRRSEKRKHKQSKKSRKSKGIVVDPDQWTAWMEEQKKKMREDILNELKSSINQASGCITQDSSIRSAFDEVNNDGGKDAEIAASGSEIEMETKDGFSTGIPLRKDDESETGHMSDVSNKSIAKEEVFSLFKSDSELDYDLEERDDAPENWKRQTSHEKDDETFNASDNKNLSRKKRDVHKKSRNDGKSHSKPHSSRSRLVLKSAADTNRDTKTSRETRRPRSSHEEYKVTERSTENSQDVNIHRKIKREDRSFDNNKEEIERACHKRSKNIEQNRSSEVEENIQNKIKPEISHHDKNTVISREKSLKQELVSLPVDNFQYKNTSNFVGHPPPLVGRTPEDGMTIASQIRDNVVKRNDFWKEDGNRKRPINPIDNVFNNESVDNRSTIDELIKKEHQTSEGHWEAPFSSIQSRLTESTNLYTSNTAVNLSKRQPSRTSIEKIEIDRSRQTAYENSRQHVKLSEEVTGKDLLTKDREDLRYSENSMTSSRRNDNRYPTNSTQKRATDFERRSGNGHERRNDEPGVKHPNDYYRSNNRDKDNRDKSIVDPKKDEARYATGSANRDSHASSDYRSRDSNKYDGRKRDYTRGEDISKRDYTRVEDNSKRDYARAGDNSNNYNKIQKIDKKTERSSSRHNSTRFSRDEPRDYREKLTAGKSSDYRDALHKNRDSDALLFPPSSNESEKDNNLSNTKALGNYTRPEKNFRNSKRR